MEYQSGKRAYDDKLQWKCHNEISAIGDQIVRDKITGKPISVIYTEDAGKCNLPYYGENLY